MKFTTKHVVEDKGFLANDHFVAIPYDCTELAGNFADGVIPAGTFIPEGNEGAKGILLNTVNLNENPNGAIVIHGFVINSKLPEEPDDAVKTALSQIAFI